MAKARRTLVCFSSALGRPRSAKTLPELGITSSLFLLIAMLCLVMLSCQTKPASSQFDIRLRCSDTAGRFLLEQVEYVDGALKPHGVGRPIRVAAVVLDDLKDSRPLASPRFRAGMFPAELGDAKSGANAVLNRFGESQQVALAAGDPEERRFTWKPPWPCHRIILVLG